MLLGDDTPDGPCVTSHHLTQICVEEAAGEGGGGGGGNFIVIVPGANYLLSPDDVAAATDRLSGAKVIMVSNTATRHRHGKIKQG